jgi:hypothetical protein
MPHLPDRWLAVTFAFGSKICAWYENDGSGRFLRHVVGTGQEAYDIRVGDLDGDGDNDFFVAGRKSDNVVVYYNRQGEATVAVAPVTPLQVNTLYCRD